MPDRPSRGTWMLLVLLVFATAGMGWFAASPETWSVFVAAACAVGVLTVLVWRRNDVSMVHVLTVAVVLRLAVVWLPPILSDDAFRYVWDGVVQLEGYNPYLHVPSDDEMAVFRDEPIFERLNSAHYYTVYPPVSQLIFRVGAIFYDQGWQVSYFVIKGILALFELAAVLVLSRILRPRRLLLYAWNPLVLIAGAGQAHGEAAAVFFLSVAIVALHKKKWGGWAAASIACAGWVKLYPFVLLPFVWRRYGWRSVVTGVGTAVLLASPYLHADVLGNVRQSLDLYVRLFEFNAGPYYAVKEIFRAATGLDWSKQLGPAFQVLYLVLLPALYVLDWKLDWSPRRAFALTIGLFFVLATTVHPWYLLGILVLVAPAQRPSWHWIWLGVLSLGTYLLYVDGPYWIWVILGWGGWALLGAYRYRRRLFDPIVRARAAAKVDLLHNVLVDDESIVDVGAGEGYVAASLARTFGIDVHLVDVVDMNRTDLPYRVYDGRELPYADNSFDAAVIVFVLHHAEDPERLLLESVRVVRRHVVVLESTYRHRWERRPLRWLDRMANEVRSDGSMRAQQYAYRTHDEWLATFKRLGLDVESAEDLGGFIHHRSLFVLSVRR
ncbi:MAG: class I SAM-dependent methyltransferase [Rhodothermales bacterium]